MPIPQQRFIAEPSSSHCGLSLYQRSAGVKYIFSGPLTAFWRITAVAFRTGDELLLSTQPQLRRGDLEAEGGRNPGGRPAENGAECVHALCARREPE
jgi:hypothetical protein